MTVTVPTTPTRLDVLLGKQVTGCNTVRLENQSGSPINYGRDSECDLILATSTSVEILANSTAQIWVAAAAPSDLIVAYF